MRLIILLLIGGFLQLSAASYSQTVTISVQQISMTELLQAVTRQTGYEVIASKKMISKSHPVNVHADHMELRDFLNLIFADQPLGYSMLDNNIILKDKNPADSKSGAQIGALRQRDVSGRVVDSLSQPMANVSVRVKGAHNSTTTNREGWFKLPGVQPGAVIIVSFLGYQPREIAEDHIPEMIVLKLSNESLQEVQVVHTGFQTLSKERATGSFGTISSSQLEKPALSIGQRLIGTVAGVQSRKLDENGKPTFEIRGQSTLYANQSPLVVVDGFAIQGDFSTLNPSDIQSVTILKDAAAASIWGARAANGVIVVTTKNAGKGSPLKIGFQAFTRIGAKLNLDYVNPLASSSETVDYERRAFNKWGAPANTGSFQTDVYDSYSLATVAMSENYLGYLSDADRDAELDRLKTLDNRSQIRENLLANPVNQQYDLSFQGGSDRLSNYLSLMYSDNQSNFKETKDKQYLLNYRTTANVFKWLDFNASAMFQYTEAHNNGVSLSDIQGLSPYEMLKNEDGSLTNVNRYYRPILERFVPMDLFPYPDFTYNPIQEIHNRDLRERGINTRLMGGLTIKPLEGLSFDSRIQYELFNTNNRNLYNENTYYVRNKVNTSSTWDKTTNTVTPNLNKGSILDQNRTEVHAWNFRNQASFNRLLGKDHEINAVAGMEVDNLVTEKFTNPTSYGYNDKTLTVGTFPNGPGGAFAPIKDWQGYNEAFSYTNVFTYTTQRYFSLYGNAAYTYLNKYTLSGSLRTDASNLITDDPSYRYSPFWSLGGSWQLRKEHFMESVAWLDQLTVRFTYGYNGNVDPSTAFRPLISTSPNPNIYTNDYTATISSYGNPTLRWEKTGSINLGLDYSLWGGKFYGKFDLYSKQVKDLIAKISIPAINGTTSQKLNNAEMSNKGIELEFGTRIPIRGDDITWQGSLNFSYNKNKITKLFIAKYEAYSLTGGGTAAYVEGYDANSSWMFQYAGVHDGQPMIKGPGDNMFNFTAWTTGDGREFMLNMGTKVAPYTLGFINSFKIYDFDLSFILTGKFGHVFNRKSFNYPGLQRSRLLPNNKLTEVLNGDPASIVPLPQNDNESRYYFWDRFYPYLSYLSENASHIRMQEIYLGYHLPMKKVKALGSSNVQVFLQGNDLFTVLFNDAGEDPEYPLGTINPAPKFTVGVKVGF